MKLIKIPMLQFEFSLFWWYGEGPRKIVEDWVNNLKNKTQQDINIQRTQKKSSSLLVLWRETLWKLFNTGNWCLFYSDFFQKTLNQGFFDFEELQRHKTEVITKPNQRTTQHWIGHPTHLCIGEWSKFRPFQIWDPWRLVDQGEVENPLGSKPRPFPYVKHSNFFLKCFKVSFS